jgi:hypothetical protein
MKQGTTAEVRTLVMHPQAIFTFIKAQAGSLGKALSEMVMNSMDAFASSVDISLTPSGFVVADNGQGFKSRDEIEAWFETFGFPHDEGNHRTYGKFGMGRAQMWAFAPTNWATNEFIMRVDVKARGLNYELDIAKEPFEGTQIAGNFYQPMDGFALHRTEQELKALVLFAPGMVTLNGKVINSNPALRKWDVDTDDAWCSFDPTARTLDVYNAGVLVANFPKYRFGCAGVVVTKPNRPLALNLARNDILVAECPVWARVATLLPKPKAKTVKKEKPALSTLQQAGQSVLDGALSLLDACERHPEILTSVNGRVISPWDFYGRARQATLFLSKGDKLGKQLAKLRLALVVDINVLQNFPGITISGLKALFAKELDSSPRLRAVPTDRYKAILCETPWTNNPAEVFKEFMEGHTVLAMADASEVEKAVISAWNRAKGVAIKYMEEAENALNVRVLPSYFSIELGDSPTRESWFDSARNRWVLRRADLVPLLTKRPRAAVAQYVLKQLRALFIATASDKAEGDKLFLYFVTETAGADYWVSQLLRHFTQEALSRELNLSPRRLSDFEEQSKAAMASD